MKKLITLCIYCGFLLSVKAQRKDKLYNQYLDYFKQGIEVINNYGFRFRATTQFGGLFTSSFLQSNNLSLYKLHFRDYDFGILLATEFRIYSWLDFKVSHNIGMLQSNARDIGLNQGAITKAIININL